MIIFRRVSGTTIMTARACAIGFGSLIDGVRALVFLGDNFWDFPVGVVTLVWLTVRENRCWESEFQVSQEPTRGSRDSSEDFVVVYRGEG